MQHGSILLCFSAENLVSVLRSPSDSLVAFTETLRTKITSLEGLGFKLEPSELALQIVDSFHKLYGITFEPGNLTKDETDLANILMKKKYVSDEWNYKRGNTRNQMRLNGIQAKDG